MRFYVKSTVLINELVRRAFFGRNYLFPIFVHFFRQNFRPSVETAIVTHLPQKCSNFCPWFHLNQSRTKQSETCRRLSVRWRGIPTVWKFQNFSIIQIFREINFRDSRGPKTAIFRHLEAFNFDFSGILAFSEGWNWPKLQIQSLWDGKNDIFWALHSPKLISRKN